MFDGVVPPAQEPAGSGPPDRRVACPAATLIAALVSALTLNPQAEQTNSAWLLRELLSIPPQALHHRLVYGAGTEPTPACPESLVCPEFDGVGFLDLMPRSGWFRPCRPLLVTWNAGRSTPIATAARQAGRLVDGSVADGAAVGLQRPGHRTEARSTWPLPAFPCSAGLSTVSAVDAPAVRQHLRGDRRYTPGEHERGGCSAGAASPRWPARVRRLVTG